MALSVNVRAGRPTFEVRPYRGLPLLFVNGQPFTHGAYLRARERYPGRPIASFEDVCATYRQQYDIGARLFLVHSTCASDFYRPELETWLAPDRFDYSHVDRFMEFVARDCPDALVMLKLNMFLPVWWENQHPDELQRFHDGRTQARFAAESDSARTQVVSLASEPWSADLTMCLRRYLEYVESRHGARILGYYICGGITHEWGILGSFDFVDYSAPMQRYWRDWRRARGLAPETPIPTAAERLAGTGDVRDPALSQPAIDFQLCLSDLVASRIIGFCETVKRETQNAKLTATYYGYTLTCREGGLKFLGRYGSGGFQGGHLAMRRVLDSPAVDIITSPYSYGNRRLGTGDLHPHYAEKSVTLAGKLSFHQDDNRSWLVSPQPNLDTGHDPDPDYFLKQLRRAFALQLCGDGMRYLQDLLGHNYDDPRILTELARLQKLYAQHARHRAASLAEVLVVLDEQAIAHLTLHSELHLRHVYRQTPVWARTGVPFHVVLLEDAARMNLSPYRLVILCNSVVSSRDREALVERGRAAAIRVLIMPDPGADLGEIAEQAGCHRYCRKGERIFVSPHLLGLHVNESGSHAVALPAGCRVVAPILPPRSWRQHQTELIVEIDRWDTAVFHTERG